MATIITYDLSGEQGPVKTDMINNKGYQISFRHTNDDGHTGNVYLPESTLYHNSKPPSQALADLKASCATYRVTATRVIAVELINWSGEWGTPI